MRLYPHLKADLNGSKIHVDKDNTTANAPNGRLAASYGEESGVTSYVREVAHEKGARVTVTDTVRGDFSAAYFTLMTQEAPVVQECAPATVGDGSTIAQPSADARNGSRATLTVAVGDIGTVTLSSISPP